MARHSVGQALRALVVAMLFAGGALAGRWLGDGVEHPTGVAAQMVEPGPAYAAPVLNVLGDDDICESWLGVQNVGTDASVALLIGVGAAKDGTYVGGPNRPTRVECSGLMRPGAGWSFMGASVPTASRAGIVLSVTAVRTLDPVGPDGDTDLVAARLCEVLARQLAADASAWPAFWTAWWTGADWSGLPLGRMGGAPLAISVHRSCPDDAVSSLDDTSLYGAVRLAAPAAGSHTVRLDNLGTGARTSRPDDTRIYVLNTGTVTATYAVRLQDSVACAPGEPVVSMAVGPGGQWAGVLSALVSSPWSGSAIVEGVEPFAVAYDRSRASSLATEADGADRLGGQADAEGGATLFAPLMLDPGFNHIDVAVHNAGASDATPRLTLFGASGDAAFGSICAGGTVTRTLTVTQTSMVSLGVLAVVDEPASGSMLTARAHVRLEREGQRPGFGGTTYDTQFAPLNPNAPAAVTAMDVIAVPMAYNDLSNSGLASDVAIVRAGGGDGALDVAAAIYDSNGLVQRICRTIGAGERSLALSAEAPGGIHVGMRGQLAVSATAWRGQAPTDAPGQLGVLTVVRKGTVAVEDAPGDESGATLGMVVTGAEAAVLRSAALAVPCGLVAEPAPARDAQGPADATVYLPMTSYQGSDDACAATIRVTNRGTRPTQLLAVLMDVAGFCAPNCAEPLEVACSSLLAPGATWTWPSGLYGASWVVLSLDADSLDTLGIRPGETRTAAEVLCAGGSIRSSCDAWRRLDEAWLLGGRFDGLPMDRLVGPPITATVGRSCPDVITPSLETVAVYDAPTGRDVALGQTRPDRWVYNLGEVYASAPYGDFSRQSIVYVQNAGLRCAQVAIAFGADPADQTRCNIDAIAPGETYALDANDCVGPSFVGPVILSSTEPLAIVADHYWPTLTQSGAVAGGEPCDVNADGHVDVDDWLAVDAALGSVIGSPRWNARADLDGNGWISTVDRDRVAACLPDGVATPTPDGRPTSVTLPTATPWMNATPGVDATPTSTGGSTGRAFLPVAFNR
ncbi:MAG: dockerin type I domain-containing protein [Ardenticatenales bacterium]